MSLVTKDDVLH